MSRVPRVLVLSRNYPNDVLPLLGLWVARLVRQAAATCEVQVVAPVPYCPPLPFLPENYLRFRRIQPWRHDGPVEIHHPRFMVPAGSRFPGLEGLGYWAAVSPLVRRLRREFPFDLIHAHFSYPDGWVAARLGRQLGVPVIVTEHAMWGPWMDRHSVLRRRALYAARECAFHIAISRALRASIVHYTGESAKLRVIPDGVDPGLFTFAPSDPPPIRNQILFVGVIRRVKGVDVLLRAIRFLTDRGRNVRLVLVGESFYQSYRLEYEQMRRLALELGITEQVEFAGGKSDQEVARYMRESALLVLPSRRESLGMVLAEALACGTPVVATRSGGPEDIVTPEVGVLVEPDDPQALAGAIEQVLAHRSRYESGQLRAYSLAKFGLPAVHREIEALYTAAITRGSRG